MSDVDADRCTFYTEFTPAKPRRKRRNKCQNLERQSPLALLQRVREELGRDDWVTECQRIVAESLHVASLASPHVLCLGLGSPSLSVNARVQLGFLLDICDYLQVDRANVSVYDPVFNDEDMLLFKELQIQPLTENKNGGHLITRPAICFLPHCDIDIYENILQANWSKENLSNMLLVANRLSDYLDSNPVHKLETRAPCLLCLAPVLHHCPLPICKSWPTAFNNIAVQFADISAIPTLANLRKCDRQTLLS